METKRATTPANDETAWHDLGRIVTAHVAMLRDAAILDDAAAATLLVAVDGVVRGTAGAVPPSTLLAQFEQRLDALTAPAVVGAAAVARGNADVLATLLRLSLRTRLLRLSQDLHALRRSLLDLAVGHVTTLMPAYSGGQPAQPTTFAHFLGGLIAPLGRAAEALRSALARVNRSPLGALSLASTSLEIDRGRDAALLAFDELVDNTFDAVAAVDHVVAVADVASAVAATIRRFLEEIIVWLRTEPVSFRLGDAWLAADPTLPQVTVPAGVERLITLARTIEGNAATVVQAVRAAPYGPVGGTTIDAIHELASGLLDDGARLATEARTLIEGGLEPNRAYLANRAGKAHTTSSDLADFLMVEEELAPAAARGIATLTIRKAIGDGVEVGGITPEMIDAAALVVIGRELRVEIENISRHLAPRRFIERRQAPGSPSPAATRAYLDHERARLEADERWRAGVVATIAAANEQLERFVAEAVEERGDQ